CDAIESVQAQTVKEVEVIVVVNGGDEDPTISSVKEYMPGGEKYDASKPEVRLLIHDMNNLGLCFNSGAQIARGEYYVQLDSDDRLTPDAVEKVLEVYNSDPKIGMVIGSYEVWEKDAAGNISRMEQIPVVTHDEWTEENGRNNLLRINGAGAPRSIPIALIKEIGFSMNEEPFARNYGEDYQMVMKISERHRIGRVWVPIYKVIRHSGGTDHSIDQATIDRNDEAKDFMRKESILRRIKLNK
ncbi:MAG TPA: glycosyltransferase family 2 protein, partial [Draconibacterium sp.]|nr:glycosyltransferase family 2 protein [Draconibacterium sp.]